MGGLWQALRQRLRSLWWLGLPLARTRFPLALSVYVTARGLGETRDNHSPPSLNGEVIPVNTVAQHR
jgi:hypothetical protein